MTMLAQPMFPLGLTVTLEEDAAAVVWCGAYRTDPLTGPSLRCTGCLYTADGATPLEAATNVLEMAAANGCACTWCLRKAKTGRLVAGSAARVPRMRLVKE